MTSDNHDSDRIAVLIDADNAMPGIIDSLLKEICKYGTPTVKRAYGDWTTPNLGSWKKVLHKHAIQPEQQFSYTKGKNATDSALIIDAMDLLYSRKFTGFCIVSSDSDFTRLATRIRQDGLMVYGFGEEKTPEPFVAACDKFVYLEVLANASTEDTPNDNPEQHSYLTKIIAEAIDTAAKDDGWASLSNVGSHLLKIDPSFDSRTYGFSKLGGLISSMNCIECKHINIGESKHMYVKLKIK